MSVRIATTEHPTGDTILARTVGRLLRDAGEEVEYFAASSGEARRVASVHEGVADMSVGPTHVVRWAYRSEAAYDSWRHTSFRVLAVLQRPLWFALAARPELAGRLGEVFERERPSLRVLCYPPDGQAAGWVHLTNELLRTQGLDLSTIRAAGGGCLDPTRDGVEVGAGEVDLVALPYGAPGLELTAWARATGPHLAPLDLGEGTAQVAARHGMRTRPLPEGSLPPQGELPMLYLPTTLVFASERMSDGLAHRIVSTLHDARAELLVDGYTLDPALAVDTRLGVPFHRAAIAYYRETGVLPPPSS